MKNKKSFRKWLKNLFNKKEVSIVLIDSKIIDELAENLKELDKSLKEFNSKHQFKGIPPIHDYKKGGKSIAIVNDIQNNHKESIFLPDGQKIIFEGGRNFGRTHFYEEWTKQINEHLRSKGLSLDKSEPFAHPIENKEPKIDYNLMFGETGKSECIGDFSEKIKASFEYWNNVWNERLKSIPNHNKNSLFGNYKHEYEKYSRAKCNHNRLRLKVLSMIANEDYPTQCEDCGQIFSYQYWLNRNSNKECKHQKVTTTQNFDSETGKVIFTSKVCNDCNADLLK